jgi:hypothetical protein
MVDIHELSHPPLHLFVDIHAVVLLDHGAVCKRAAQDIVRLIDGCVGHHLPRISQGKDLLVDVNGEVLAEDVGLEILVLIVLRLVVLGLRLRLVFVTDEELVKDLQQLLYLVHTLKHLVLLANQSWEFLAALFLCVTVEEFLLHLPIAVVSSILGRGGVALVSPCYPRRRRGCLAALLRSVFALAYLFLSLLEDIMRLNLIKNDFSVVPACRTLDLLCQRGELVDRIGNFLGEPQDKGPNQQEEDDAAADHYSYQVFELIVDLLLQRNCTILLLVKVGHTLQHHDHVVDLL